MGPNFHSPAISGSFSENVKHSVEAGCVADGKWCNALSDFAFALGKLSPQPKNDSRVTVK